MLCAQKQTLEKHQQTTVSTINNSINNTLNNISFDVYTNNKPQSHWFALYEVRAQYRSATVLSNNVKIHSKISSQIVRNSIYLMGPVSMSQCIRATWLSYSLHTKFVSFVCLIHYYIHLCMCVYLKKKV